MYPDVKRKKTHVIRVRFDDYEYGELQNKANLTGEQMAVLVRDLVNKALHNDEFILSLQQK